MNWWVLLPMNNKASSLEWLDGPESSPLSVARQLYNRYGGQLIATVYGPGDALASDLLGWAKEAGATAFWHLELTETTPPSSAAAALAQCVKNRSDIVFIAQGQCDVTVPAMLGATLDIPVVPSVRAIEGEDLGDGFVLQQGRSQGWQMKVAVKPPAVVLIDPRFFSPLYLTVRQKARRGGWAFKVSRQMIEATDEVAVTLQPYRRAAIGGQRGARMGDAKSRLGALTQSASPASKRSSIVEGSTEEAVGAIIALLRDKGLLPE